ncbi:MAG: S66 peptidase family protein [Halopenitus sp.]
MGSDTDEATPGRVDSAFTTPPALEAGDTVAVVAPSRPPSEPKLSIGRERLEALGVETTLLPTAQRTDAEEPAPPAERAAELEDAFRDPTIGGVMAYSGGDDQLRVLSHLDGDVLAANPTRFFGYSDNDNFRLYLWNRGIVSFGIGLHPDLTCDPELNAYTERYLRRALFDDSLGTVEPADEWTDDWYDFEDPEPREWDENPGPTISRGDEAPNGEVTGRLWGASFAILKWHLQTDRYLPDPAALDGAILALETSEDVPVPREVGYTLRAMGERGLLERFDGVVVGRAQIHSPHIEWEPEREEYPARLRSVVEREVSRYNPGAVVGFGYDFGHTAPAVPLPLGERTTIRSDGSLRFE